MVPVLASEATSSRVHDRSPLAYRIAYLLGRAVLSALFKFEFSGRENVPERGYIAVANHLNWIDAFAVLIALPHSPRPHFIGWDTVMRAKKLWWLIRVSNAGFIPVPRDRSERAPRRRELHAALIRCLNAGFPLAIFPEGSVGLVEGQVADFKPGFARLAAAAQAPVIPIALSGTRKLWLRKRIRIVIGKPLTAPGDDWEGLAQRARAAVIDLMPDYVDPQGVKLFAKPLTRLIPSLTNWTSSDL